MPADPSEFARPVAEARRARAHRNIYTVPPGQPFLLSVARAILTGNLPVPAGAPPSALDLARFTLYLPTRRATRALQSAFLDAGGGQALLLPRFLPIAEGEEDLALLGDLTHQLPTSSSMLHEPIGELERRLALTRLVLRWSTALRADGSVGETDRELAPVVTTAVSTPAQAVCLATELARLTDMLETEGVSLDRLADLVPDNFAEHWQQTLKFLEIITAYWPAYLAEAGLTSPAARRNDIIRAEARRLRTNPPTDPVVVAGVTGSVPATTELMAAVADLPNGCIVLPALDLMLDEESWQSLAVHHPEHPQHGLARLLATLAVPRSAVHVLPGAEQSQAQKARARLVSETMRPQSTTGRWQAFLADPASPHLMRTALEGVSIVECANVHEEADVIALMLRQALETPGRTAALISPDRLLARRVGVRLETWGLKIDDSAGRPFAKTVPGAFLDLVIAAFTSSFAPADVVALLKHPLTRLGLDAFTMRASARALEIIAFRQPYFGIGLDGIAAAIDQAAQESETGERRGPALKRLWREDWDRARHLVTLLREAYEPLRQLAEADCDIPLCDIARAHVQTAERLAERPRDDAVEAKTTRENALWQDEAGATAQAFFGELLNATSAGLAVPLSQWADLYRSLIAGLNVRPRGPVHPRLAIWGPIEARLQMPDFVILGSLNDGTWPQAADPGPWLNRPMRASLGLPQPEEATGREAHDFATLLGAPQVVLTRSKKVDGVPSVPSRWLLRLKALLAGSSRENLLTPSAPWLAWARQQRRAHSTMPRLAIPEPRPPVALRPRKLSVSRVEDFIKNPYAIFAREILGLEPMDRLGADPGPALRGSVLHAALSQLTREFPSVLPPYGADRLVDRALAILDAHRTHPRIAAFWIPRIRRFAKWYVATESARRQGVNHIHTELSGQLVFDAPAGAFTLNARADRIDIMPDRIVITDYKTGGIPKRNAVESGFAPQLPLEAAIAAAEGFAGVPAGRAIALRYIRATGGIPPGEQDDVASDASTLAAQMLENFKALVALFDDEATPYRPVRRHGLTYDFDDYAHLARVAEWSASGMAGSEEVDA